MKKNRISAILFLAVILSVIIYSAYGMVNQGKDDDYISVSVIVNDSSNTRWNAFREGLEQGAEDNQVHLNLVSTGSFQNVQEENTIVKRELEGGADGIIVEPYSGEADSVLQGVAADSVVLVKTGIETDTLYTSVMTDHIKFGDSLADAVIEAGETRVGIFSGNQSQLGMRQRLGIAQAIMENPNLIILDEPMNGLDKKGIEDVKELLLKLKGDGKTILMASHYAEDMEICDEVFQMEDGKLGDMK